MALAHVEDMGRQILIWRGNSALSMVDGASYKKCVCACYGADCKPSTIAEMHILHVSRLEVHGSLTIHRPTCY